VETEEMYLQRRYLGRHKTVSFAEDLSAREVIIKARKTVTSILKRKLSDGR
jgi:hypothetical protein